ncbi:MAG: tetratricopeptide repeat protein [Gemmatimonadota bacterium]|nr:tetratricopeptide repeat protein [Gemmatimonadota bacterium]
MARGFVLGVALQAAALGASAQTADPCGRAGEMSEAGWALYRGGDLVGADRIFSDVLGFCPSHPGALVGSGYIALRAGDARNAEALFTSVVDADPDHVDALIGVGLARSRLGRLGSAEQALRKAHDLAPESPDAHLGLARVLAWQGRPGEAETLYASAAERWPENAEAHLGLARSLENQGRARAAQRVLERALRAAPGSEQIAGVFERMAVDRRLKAGASFIYESDSDRNRIRSLVLRTTWQPYVGLEVRSDTYVRESKVDREFYYVRRATGLRLGVVGSLDPGWQFRAGIGGSENNVPGVGTLGLFDASIATPRRHVVTGVLGFSKAPLDATSVLIERGVEIEAWTGELLTNRWAAGEARLSASYSNYTGVQSNRRWHAALHFLRRPWGPLRMGLDATFLGFEDDVNEGYFDPSFYVLALVPMETRVDRGPWSAAVTVSPGVEHIGGGAGNRGAIRTEAEVTLAVPVGLALSLGGIYTTTGAQALWADEFAYRYFATSASVRWSF